MKILTFIPARAGSKGIKNKNMVAINKKPLIYYTLNVARKIGINTYPFISSDSKKIIIAGIKITEKWPAAIVTAGTSFKYFFIIFTLKPYKNEHSITNPAYK